MTLKQTLHYEVGTCNFIMSLMYTWFPKYFMWVVKRKHRRYQAYMKMIRQNPHLLF